MTGTDGHLFDPPPPVDSDPDPDVERRFRRAQVTTPTVGSYGRDDPDTSVDAAISGAISWSKARVAVLRELVDAGEVGLTDLELEARLGWDRPSGGNRRLDLVAAGYVVDSGQRRRTPSGRSATVWCVTDAGRAEYRRLVRAGKTAA